ncbi:MAG TPA: hypothetical protein DCR97_08315 [Deltaproteobacteria bacterium]|nr:hypothetical protein [Deltaproteobacteria bacterium]
METDLDALIASLEKKLSDTRELIEGFDEAMDYATHCALQGFAEGIDFAIEELKQYKSGGK